MVWSKPETLSSSYNPKSVRVPSKAGRSRTTSCFEQGLLETVLAGWSGTLPPSHVPGLEACYETWSHVSLRFLCEHISRVVSAREAGSISFCATSKINSPIFQKSRTWQRGQNQLSLSCSCSCSCSCSFSCSCSCSCSCSWYYSCFSSCSYS